MNRYKVVGILGILVLIIFLVVMATEIAWLRLALAVLFCLVAPGSGWALNMKLKDAGDTLAMSVMLSIGCTVLVATALAVSHVWSIPLGCGILALITAIGFMVALGKKRSLVQH